MTIQGSYVGSLPEMAELVAIWCAATACRACRSANGPLPTSTWRIDELKAGKVVGRVVLTPA